ncbi:hypothetical protein MMC29_001604 [Sticta canariensis]|nr:hypothetical protein [Sticta canariensis]
MVKAVAADWRENEWTLGQIQWVEEHYRTLSRMIIKRKQELTVTNQQDQLTAQLAVQPANPRARSDNTTNSHIGAVNFRFVLAAPVAPLATVAPLAPLAPGAPLATVPLALPAPVAFLAQVGPPAPIALLAPVALPALPTPQQTSGQLQQLSSLMVDPSPLAAEQLFLKQPQQFQPTGQAQHSQIQPNDPPYVESNENSLTLSGILETTESAITTNRLADHVFLQHITLKAKTIKNDLATVAAYAAAYRDTIASFCQVKVKGLVWRLILQQPLPDWVRKGEG